MEITIAKKANGKWVKVSHHANCNMGWINHFASQKGFTEEDAKKALEDGKAHRGQQINNRHLWIAVRMQEQWLVQVNTGRGWSTEGCRKTKEQAESLLECMWGKENGRVVKWVH